VERYARYSSFCHSRTERCTQNVPSVWDIFGLLIWSEVLKRFEDGSNVISILDTFKHRKIRGMKREISVCALKPRGSLFILHVTGISGKYKRIGNRYNIRTVFKTKNAFTPSLVITRPKEDPQFYVQHYTCIWQELRQSYLLITH